MDSSNHDFQGALKDEKIQFFFRKHAIHLVKTILFGLLIGVLIFMIFLLIGGLLTFVQIALFRLFYVYAVMIVSITYLHIFALQVVSFFYDFVIVTDYRILIVNRTVFLKNDNDAIDLTKIQDIGVESRGIFRNYLKYGKLIITLSTSIPPVEIICVPDPHYYLERCNRVKRDYIMRRRETRHSLLNEIPVK